MPREEAPKEFSARRFRVAVERAKVAVMEAQQVLAGGFRGNPKAYQELTDSALRKLDKAWFIASQQCRKD